MASRGAPLLRATSISVALLAGTALLLPACKDGGKAPSPTSKTTRVPSPLENPAGHCRDSCPLKVHCRLGQAPKALLETEVAKCRDACLVWIKDHPDEAAALWPCYDERQCSAQRACLAEVGRILEDRATPSKIKECDEMCTTLGTCQGDATDCRLRCKTGAVSVFRALYRCGTKRCPELRDCVEAVLSGKARQGPEPRPTAVDTP
jgi:hypothetical protein